VPDLLRRTVLDWFRSSGRFIWPVAWLLMALGIVGTLSTTRPRRAIAISAVALMLQWIDLSLWRSKIGDSVRAPLTTVFESDPDRDEAFREMAARRRVTVIPSFWCLGDPSQRSGVPWTAAYFEIQLMAARANAAMYAPVMARSYTDCDRERKSSLSDLADDGVLIVVNQPREFDRIEEARQAFACRAISIGAFCTKHGE